MMKITKDEFLKIRNDTKTHRKCFAKDSGVQKRKQSPTFSTPEGFLCLKLNELIEYEIGLRLSYSKPMNNYWCYITAEQIPIIEDWERSHGTTIFLRDCLSMSIALDTNLQDNTSGRYTEICDLENRAKNQQDEIAIQKLADIVTEKILRMPFYKDADFVCAIPPSPNKNFDLPSSVVNLISENIKKQNITSCFKFNNCKEASIKNATLSNKWDIWDRTGLCFENNENINLNGKKIILIDDKYQSGITIQYIAMKLQEAGASEI